MLNNGFAVLTGHLNDYPLADIVGVLRHQHKTGRLLIEYGKGPATFYFNEGDLVDAQFGDLVGLQAICVAMAQPPAAFNFNPLIRPTRKLIENSLQRVISELLGCWDESFVQIDTVATEGIAKHPLPPTLSPEENTVAAELRPLALPGLVAQKPAGNYGRLMLAMVALALILLGLSTGIAVIGKFGRTPASTPESSSSAEGMREQRAESTHPQANAVAEENESRMESAARHEPSRSKGAGVSLEVRSNTSRRSTPIETVKAPDAPDLVSAVGKADTPEAKLNTEQTSAVQSIEVVMQIENGRVSQASVSRRKAGMESYEAMALRIARQRRYPSKTDGQETVTIRVNQP